VHHDVLTAVLHVLLVLFQRSLFSTLKAACHLYGSTHTITAPQERWSPVCHRAVPVPQERWTPVCHRAVPVRPYEGLALSISAPSNEHDACHWQ
jgi:hypothetical protein